MTNTEYDANQGYCRKLGHHLKFAYCRTERGGQPCTRILDCWFESFDVKEFVAEHHPQVLQPSPVAQTKAQTLLDLIEQAHKRQVTT